jgi:tyrosyl-tRNA synthetase
MNTLENVYYSLRLGVKEIISESGFYSLLFKKKNLVIKIGFDPTSSKLHLGHYVILKKIKDFQKFGYCIHLIVGDFTAAIGDPSGKSFTRRSVDHNNVRENYMVYDSFFFRFLDKNLTFIYFNSVWFNFICLSDFIQLVSFSTISRILERSDFKNRYINNKPIGLHEFIYPLLQSYDSVFLNTDIEIGGIDQKFNLLLARDLQKMYFQSSQVLIMMPILTGLDGLNKMSKSLNNCISLDDNCYDIFCKIMSISDELLEEYFVSLGYLDQVQFKSLLITECNPMIIKMLLAYNVVVSIYNDDLAKIAKNKFINVVSKKNFDNDVNIDNIYIDFDTISLIDVFLQCGFIESNSEFKRFIKAGAIKVNNVIVYDRLLLLSANSCYLLQIGKKIIKKIFLKKNEKNVI